VIILEMIRQWLDLNKHRAEVLPQLHRLLITDRGPLDIRGPLTAGELRHLSLSHDLDSFRPPERQQEALVDISRLPEGRVYAAISGKKIVGYVTFHRPEKFERWGQAGIKEILELGALEVSRSWRGVGAARALLDLISAEDWIEEYIIIACEYSWHWDLEGSGLSVWQYRAMMESLQSRLGMKNTRTDDPDICDHPANMLAVRIGNRVSRPAIEAFDRLRFRRTSVYS
jgi:acetoin utilization protein AcuA